MFISISYVCVFVIIMKLCHPKQHVPFTYKNTDGSWSGICFDIIRTLAEDMNFKWQELRWW